jgi:hypothetical protein
MKKQHQTIIDKDIGNCFATCIACLLDLDVADVPNFITLSDLWWREFTDWLNARGYSAIMVDMRIKGAWSGSMACWSHALCVVGGQSPRGDYGHAVVGRMTGWLDEGDELYELVHDPHPDGTGIVGKPHDFLFLVPNDPTKNLP